MLGGREADMHNKRRLEVRNQISSRMGSISVRTARNDQMRMVEACVLRERGGLKGWGVLEANMHKEKRFEVRNGISSRMGSISVRTARNDQMRMGRACGMREKGLLKAWESWSPECTTGACLALDAEYRAPRARYRRDLWEMGSRR